MTGPSRLDSLRLVAGREFGQRFRSRSFRVGTAVMALLASVVAFLPSVLPAFQDPEWNVAVAGERPAGLERTVRELAEVESAEVTLRDAPAGSPAEIARREGVDAVVVDGRRVVVDAAADDRLGELLGAAVGQARLTARLSDAGVDPGMVRSATDVPVRTAGADEGGDERQGVTFLGVVVLFMAIATYGTWVLNSVLEEKASRVIEIVISTVSPQRLLAGKVVGNGLAGLLQLLLVGAVAVTVLTVSDNLPELPASGPITVAAVVGFFILGFAFYAVGYAAAGSLVSRQEDAQSANTPMLALVLTAYFLTLFVVNADPGSTAARIISLVPPITPLAMPVRIATGDAQTWEVALGVGLMLLATWLMVSLAARIYANAILRTGARVPFREALR